MYKNVYFLGGIFTSRYAPILGQAKYSNLTSYPKHAKKGLSTRTPTRAPLPMGRLVKKSEKERREEASGRQGTLLDFLAPRRKPLVDANANTDTDTDTDKKDLQQEGFLSGLGVGAPRKKPPEVQEASEQRPSPPELVHAGACEVVAAAQWPPRKMADSLERIEKVVCSWERLFASYREAHVNAAEAAAAVAERTARSLSSLAAASYEHRVMERKARASTRWTTSLRVRQYHAGVAGGVRPLAAVVEDKTGSRSSGKRTLELAAHTLMLDRLCEVGVCHLPGNLNGYAAVSNLGDPVVAMTFDPSGRFVASASAGGLLAVQSADTLRVSEGQLYEPRFQRRGLGDAGNVSRSLSSIAWSGCAGSGGGRGGKDNVIATVSGESNKVELVDVFANRTAFILCASSGGSSNGGGSGAFTFGGGRGGVGPGGGGGGDGAGLLDVAFSPGESNRVLASGRRGRVYLWDDRCSGGRPRAELSAPLDRSPVHCVRASPDGQTVIAGTESGAVHIWDLRGGTKARAAAFSVATQAKVSHSLLRSLDVAELLGRVPVLRDGPVSVGRSAVHWCEQDPHDTRRLGFHLACGWSGVVDLTGGFSGGGGLDRGGGEGGRYGAEGGAGGLGVAGAGGRGCSGGGSTYSSGPFVTHAHCPPPPWETTEDGTRRLQRGVDGAALSHRRSAAWVTIGTGGGGAACAALAVGCPGVAGLRLLDFSPTPTARHWVAGLHAADLEAEEREEEAAAAAVAAAVRVADNDDSREGATGDALGGDTTTRGGSGGVGKHQRQQQWGGREGNATMEDERGMGGDGGGGEGGGHQDQRRVRGRGGRWWREDPVSLSGPALAVAAHPWAPDQLLAGSWGMLCLVAHR